MRLITFHDRNTVTTDFLEERFPCMRWFLTEFEINPQKYYLHTECFVIDKILRNFYVLYNCDFKIYMKHKPGNYVLLFHVLADAQDRYASRAISYLNPPISNPEKKGNIHDLVMETSKDILHTGRNVTGDRRYSAIDTVEEIYQKTMSEQ